MGDKCLPTDVKSGDLEPCGNRQASSRHHVVGAVRDAHMAVNELAILTEKPAGLKRNRSHRWGAGVRHGACRAGDETGGVVVIAFKIPVIQEAAGELPKCCAYGE